MLFGQPIRLSLGLPDEPYPGTSWNREILINGVCELLEAIIKNWNSDVIVANNNFKPEDKVYILKVPTPSHGVLYDRPYVITEVLDYNVIVVQDPGNPKSDLLIHASRLKKVSQH